jgi:hypothetical protein
VSHRHRPHGPGGCTNACRPPHRELAHAGTGAVNVLLAAVCLAGGQVESQAAADLLLEPTATLAPLQRWAVCPTAVGDVAS